MSQKNPQMSVTPEQAPLPATNTPPESNPPEAPSSETLDLTEQMQKLAETVGTLAQSQAEFQKQALEYVQAQQPDQRYLSSLEQGQALTGQPQDIDMMTQSELYQHMMTEVSRALGNAGSQYGTILQTILPEHEVWKPEIRKEMGDMISKGVPFDKAYELVKAKNKPAAAQTPEEIQAAINKGVQAEIDRRERAKNASVAEKPGRTGAEKAQLSPRELLRQQYQELVIEGKTPDPKFTKGL